MQLLKPLGFSENAIRLVLSRMARHGYVTGSRRGRVSYYSLTRKGNTVMQSSKKNTGTMEKKSWDNTWYCVVYTVPEKKRYIRDSLRAVLKGLGYGNLGNLWISPYGFTNILTEHIKKMNAQEYVETFRAHYTGSLDLPKLAAKIWDIRGLKRRYVSFIKKYQAKYDVYKEKLSSGIQLTPEYCFAERFRVTTEYIDIVLDDPMLPEEMLPTRWTGSKAKKLAYDVKTLLTARADEYVSMVMHQEKGRSQKVRKKSRL
jgi:phenylacetic acid degradation operon negative regulatory protein